MSAPSNGDKPAYIEYTAPTRKNVRRTPKPLRDIGVEQFVRPGGTLIDAGHILPGSAFDTLARKKKPLQNQGGKRVKMSQYEVGEKTGNGGKTDLKGKTGVDDKTNNPAVAPGARGDTPRQGFNATDWDESLWGEHDESIDGIKPQEARQKRNDRVLKDLRPNVAIPAPAARTLKAKAGAWGASKLAKPAKDVVNTAAHPTADKADSNAYEAFDEKKKRQALAAKNKPTTEEKFRNDYLANRNERPVVQVSEGEAEVEPRGQPPQRKQRKRKASPPPPFFSEDEEDEDDDDDIPVVTNKRPGCAKPAARIQTHDTRSKKATSALPAKAVVDHFSEEEDNNDNYGKDDNDDDDDDDDDDEDDEDDIPVPSNNRRRRTKPASRPQPHGSQDEKAVGNQHSQDDDDENGDNDDDDENDAPIVQTNRRRRAQPAQPSQPNDIPNQPTGPPLSDNAAINQLMQLGAPPTQAHVLAHIPLAQFPIGTTASQPQPQPQPERQTQRQPQRQPQPERQPQAQSQTPPKKGVARPLQPKRSRPTTAATTNKQDTTPSPPSKKPRVARKTEPQKPVAKREPAKTVAKTAAAKADVAPAAPAKKGVAAIKGKKGVAVKKSIPKKGRNRNKGCVLVTDESGSD